MRCLVVVLLLVAAATAASVPGTPLWEGGYHAAVGMPQAAQLRQQESARIIGGEPAPLGAHPYLVGVVITLEDGISVCGSTLLSATRALTAAHCWWDGWRQAKDFTLVLGSEHIFFGGVRVLTDDVTMHPEWDTAEIKNDLAMVAFEKVELSAVIQPIALPSGDQLSEDFTDVIAQIAGYGLTADDATLTPNQILRHVRVQVISHFECEVYYRDFVRDSTICTRGSFEGQFAVGACGSDSGGPLSIERDGESVLIGVISYGSRFCASGWPTGYSRITSYTSWIKENS